MARMISQMRAEEFGRAGFPRLEKSRLTGINSSRQAIRSITSTIVDVQLRDVTNQVGGVTPHIEFLARSTTPLSRKHGFTSVVVTMGVELNSNPRANGVMIDATLLVIAPHVIQVFGLPES